MAKTYHFRGRGIHALVERKHAYKVINEQVIIQILMVNAAFYMYDNIRLKVISMLNSFEQIQENGMRIKAGSKVRKSEPKVGSKFGQSNNNLNVHLSELNLEHK